MQGHVLSEGRQHVLCEAPLDAGLIDGGERRQEASEHDPARVEHVHRGTERRREDVDLPRDLGPDRR